MVPTFVKFARSSKAFWLCLPIDFDGASSFLLHLAICGDFSWPFMSILMWPLTIELITQEPHDVTDSHGGGSISV